MRGHGTPRCFAGHALGAGLVLSARLVLGAGLILGTALVLGGCLGPNFHRPAPPTPPRFTIEPLAPQTASAAGPGGAAQTFLAGADVPKNWWTLFGSAELCP